MGRGRPPATGARNGAATRRCICGRRPVGFRGGAEGLGANWGGGRTSVGRGGPSTTAQTQGKTAAALIWRLRSSGQTAARRPRERPFSRAWRVAGRPPARLPVGAGKPASRTTHSTAVHAIRSSAAEPERSAAFTDFHFHSQVLHFSVLQGVQFPWGASRIFQRSEGARLRLLGAPVFGRGTLFGPFRRRAAPVSRLFQSAFDLRGNDGAISLDK